MGILCWRFQTRKNGGEDSPAGEGARRGGWSRGTILPHLGASSVAAVDPLLQVRLLRADRGGVAVAGVDHGGLRQREQALADGLDDRVEVRVRAAGGAGPALEQGVAGEHDAGRGAVVAGLAQRGGVQADRAGGVAGGVQHPQLDAGHAQDVALGERAVVRQADLLDDLEAASERLSVAFAAGQLRRLDVAGERLEGNVSPELVVDALALGWASGGGARVRPGKARAA